jgi:hypothetical protein
MSGPVKLIAMFCQQGLVGGNYIFASFEHFELDLFGYISAANGLDAYLDSVIVQKLIDVIGKDAIG